MSLHYGLHPWDVDRLTIGEIKAYITHHNNRVAEQKKAASKRRR